MLIIFPVYSRVKLLPYFLRYYSSIGITHFVCALYDGKNNPLYQQIIKFSTRYNLTVRTSIDSRVKPYNPYNEMHGLNKIRREFRKKYDWYCIADLDEFHFFNGLELIQVRQKAEKLGCVAAGGKFVDRVAENGAFPPIRGPLDETFPLGCDLTFCLGARHQKISMAQSNIEICLGHHNVKAKVAWGLSETHHFKWHRGMKMTLQQRYKNYSKQGIPWAKRELPLQLRLAQSGINFDEPSLRIRRAQRLGI
jgi:hypothetical protein